MSTYHSIIIKNYVNVFEEFAAAAAITPGMLVEQTPAAATVRKHANASKNAIPMFAIEDALQGKGITDNYAAGDTVRVWIPQRGDQVYALIADEENIAIGDALTSNGDGFLRKDRRTYESFESADVMGTHEVYPLGIVAFALEALDLTALSAQGSSDTPFRQHIKVRIV